MNNYFNDLYNEVFDYTYESLTDTIICDGCVITESYDGDGVLVVEAKTGKKKKVKKKHIFGKIALLILAITGLVAFCRVVKRGYEKKIKEAESRGYNKGYKKGRHHGSAAGYQHGLTKGRNEEREKSKRREQQALYDGMGAGLKKGYRNGYDDGVKKGFDDGKESSDIMHLLKSEDRKKKERPTRRPLEATKSYNNSNTGNNKSGNKYIDKYNAVVRRSGKLASQLASDYHNQDGVRWNPNDALGSIDDLIKALTEDKALLEKMKKEHPKAYLQMKRSIEQDEDAIDDAQRYKAVFEVAKDVKGIGNKIMKLGNDVNIKMPETLKQKLDDACNIH